MIEQQYYTRERGGLFSQTDGYDTVAKSPQLKLDYIKKNLHPLCSYDIPSELQKSGEQDENKYPPNMIVMPGGAGEMIIGQAVYKSKDFTGLRSTFFMHNFILSENEKRRYIKEPEKIFGITGFKKSFDLMEGRQLPTLAAIPYEGNNVYFLERERLFSRIGMTKEHFHKLIAATFAAVNSKKKVFIILDTPIEQLGELAKALLYHLYCVLPWSITERLGISTYASKMEAKKNIHITFLDKEALRFENKQSKDFIFDFVNKRVLNIEGDIEKEPYIKTGLPYCKNKAAWEKINYWSDAMSSNLKDSSERELTYYGRICTLFEMSLCFRAGKSYDLLDPKIRKGLLPLLLGYLQEVAADDIRKEMFELMEKAISILQEEIRNGILWEPDEIKALLTFKLEYCRNREQEVHCIQILLYLLNVASRDKKDEYINEVLILVHRYPNTYLSLFEAICASEELKKQMLYPLINDTFKEVDELEKLIEQMARFEELEVILMKEHYYTQVIYEKFGGCLRKVRDMMSFLNHLQRWCEQHKGAVYDNLLEEGEYYFLEHLELKGMSSEESLCQLRFSRSYPLENYEVIKAYQALKSDLSCMNPNKIKINSKVQELIKMFYRQKVRKDDFYLMVYAFLEMDPKSYRPKLNLKRVLQYLNSVKPSIMLEFIIWSKDQELYIDKAGFDGQVINFFINMKQKEGRIPKEAIKEKLGSQAKTKVLSERILNAVRPNFVKWTSHHKGLVALLGGVMIGTASIIGFLRWQSANSHPAVSKKVKLDPEIVAKLMPGYTTDREQIELFLDAKLEGLPSSLLVAENQTKETLSGGESGQEYSNEQKGKSSDLPEIDHNEQEQEQPSENENISE